MAPRNPELPEGTDHIINGAMETGAGADASTGSSGGGDSSGVDFGAPGGDGGAAIGGGFVAGGGSGVPGDDTGGTAVATTGGGVTGSTGAPVKEQLRDSVQSLKQQATDRVRSVADDGKARATTALDDLSRKISEAGSSIDEKLGGEYGDYARRAAEAVSSLSDTLRDKDVEELWDDARNVVRKSPGVALGIAAVVGFTLARVIKAGVESGGNDRGDVDFTPDGGRNIAFEAEGSGGGSAGKSA